MSDDPSVASALTHADARQAASRVLDEPVPRETERSLAIHLVACSDCRSFYESIRRSREQARAQRGSVLPHGLTDHAAARAAAILRGEPDPGPAARTDDAESTGELDPARDVPAGDSADDTSILRAPVPVPPPTARADPSPFDDHGPAQTSRREQRAERREGASASSTRRGPWLLAIAATAALALIATLIVTRGDVVRDRLLPRLPDAAEVRRRAQGAFDSVRTMETSFRIARLDLYRQPGDKLVYAFTTGTRSGRLVYEEPDHLREEWTLDVPGQPARRRTTIQRDDAVDVTSSSGDDVAVEAVSNPPPGPPDGPLLARFGVLEDSLTSVAQMLAASGEIDVQSRGTIAGRRTLRVAFEVEPSAFTRADRIVVHLDEATYVPLRAERSIARRSAGVLGPEDVLTPAALDAQFGERERTVTETVELSDLKLNESVLPGEFVASHDEGADVQTRDGRWQRTSRGDLADDLEFEPLYPSSLPAGFRESSVALYSGRPQAWGPGNSFPAPEGAMQAVYWDNKTTVVVSERRITRGRDRIDESPLSGGELPMTTESLVRSGRRLTYAVSPEVPPHVYGFAGDVFVMVAGYAPREDLVRIASSLRPADETPQPQPSPSPREPGESPGPETTEGADG